MHFCRVLITEILYLLLVCTVGRAFKVGAEGCLSHTLTTGCLKECKNAYGKNSECLLKCQDPKTRSSRKSQILNFAINWLWINKCNFLQPQNILCIQIKCYQFCFYYIFLTKSLKPYKLTNSNNWIKVWGTLNSFLKIFNPLFSEKNKTATTNK